jgi:hypothetical protein
MAKKKSKSTLSSAKKSPHAPYNHAGYSLQTTRLAARLLESDPGSILSLEVFDDVGEDLPDGTRIAEQSKLSLDGNPVADRAIGLWKTLSNWVDAVRIGELDPAKTKFELYVSKPVSGPLVEGFSSAGSMSGAVKAIEDARQLLWGAPPIFSKKLSLADSIRDYVNNVLEADEAITRQIILAFALKQGGGVPQKDFEDLIRKRFVTDEMVSQVADQALGWVKSRTDELLQQGKPAYIERDKFFIEITAFVRRIDRQNILCSFAPDPTQEQIDRDIAAKTYIRQLQIIDLGYEDQIEAVIDYLRSSSDRTMWAAQALVHEDSFKEFQDGLQKTWKHLKRETDLTYVGQDEVGKGQLLYSKCSLHTAKLQNMDLENHFTRGSFHALSNERVIGWHPDYKSKLK